MRTWSIELGGTITRDIIWRETEAETEQEVREICARELPSYRVRSIIPSGDSPGNSDTTTPAAAGGSQDKTRSK